MFSTRNADLPTPHSPFWCSSISVPDSLTRSSKAISRSLTLTSSTSQLDSICVFDGTDITIRCAATHLVWSYYKRVDIWIYKAGLVRRTSNPIHIVEEGVNAQAPVFTRDHSNGTPVVQYYDNALLDACTHQMECCPNNQYSFSFS